MTAHVLRLALLGAPGVLLAVLGLSHPGRLTHATSTWWTLLHVLGLFLFPLVGLALAMLVQGRYDLFAWAVRVSAYLYATAYTALDLVSGVTAGYVTWRAGDVPRLPAVRWIFDIGDWFGELGAVALLTCAVLLVGRALARYGVPAAPAVVLVVGAFLVHEWHIIAPWGSLGMLLVGAGTVWLARLQAGPGQKSRSLGSSIPRNAS